MSDFRARCPWTNRRIDMRKSPFLSRAACLFLAMGIVTAALAQGGIRIVSPKPNEVVRGEVEARFDKPFPDQGYTIIHLDGEFKEASALNRYIINTRDLPDGDHNLLI